MIQSVGKVEEWASWRPPQPLRRYVASYTGYRQAGMPPATHRGLPSPRLTVIVTLDDPLLIAEHPDPGQPGGAFDALVGGLHTRPATIVHDGAQSGVQLGVTPLGARALLGLPAGELAELDLPADVVLGAFAGTVQDAVRSARTWRDRFVALDALLLSRVAAAADRRCPGIDVHPDVARAWSVVLRSRGTLRVGELARDLGCGERHLRTLFTREVGLSPKEAARVIRFDHARRRLLAGTSQTRESMAGGRCSLADLAASCGYYDQSHLDRDFRRFAGASPTQWLADELRNVQVPQLVEGPG